MGRQPIMKLDFINTKINKHLSSSTLPTTCTIANLANLTYLGKLVIRMWDVVTSRHILVGRLMSNGGAMHAIALDFIVNLKSPCWHSRSPTLRNLKTLTSCPFKVEVLPQQNAILKTSMCFQNDTSTSSWN